MLRHSVQHDQGEGVKLTEGLWCPERGGGRPAARPSGSDARGDRGWAEVGLLQVCWSPKSKHTGPAEVLRGQHGQGPDDGEQSRWRRPLPTCKLGLIPDVADAHGPIAGLGKL
jgi:hypothetical protein